ncbi:MAG: hypothetical protein QMB33_02505, partial [Opitutales bacterium]
MSSETTSPLTFDLQQELLDKLKQLQKKVGARSLSEIVRYAVSIFDSSDIDLKASVHRQISVRLSSELRQRLTRLSQQKQVSVGELLRAALESLPAELSDFNPKQTMPKKKITTKKATKKIAKKAPAKKAVNKKVAPKKATKKTVAKKAAPKKKAVKKAVKKAAPKKAVKKAAPKKVAKKVAPKKVAKKA